MNQKKPPASFLYDLFKDLKAETLCVGVARVGWPDQKIGVCTLEEMSAMDLGQPLHSLVIVGKLHPLEEDYLRMFNPLVNSS